MPTETRGGPPVVDGGPPLERGTSVEVGLDSDPTGWSDDGRPRFLAEGLAAPGRSRTSRRDR